MKYLMFMPQIYGTEYNHKITEKMAVEMYDRGTMPEVIIAQKFENSVKAAKIFNKIANNFITIRYSSDGGYRKLLNSVNNSVNRCMIIGGLLPIRYKLREFNLFTSVNEYSTIVVGKSRVATWRDFKKSSPKLELVLTPGQVKSKK